MTNRELAKMFAELDVRVRALENNIEEIPPLPVVEEVDLPQQEIPPCRDCGHPLASHVPLSEKACFLNGCNCKGYNLEEKKEIKIKFPGWRK